MLFLQYPPCSTCQKAKKWLDEHGIVTPPAILKRTTLPLTSCGHGSLRAACPSSGSLIRAALSTKNLGLKDKLPAMSEEEQIALLASDGMLVKRPLLVADDFVLPGFKPAEWEKALL